MKDCNCGKKINCGCTLAFSSFVSNPVSVLDVGTLDGGSCSFDEYVIDWFRDGDLYMTSGVGDDPDIEAYHPFTGTAAIPVINGTFVPVVRYVILSGETTKIFPAKKPCQDYCDFTNNLPSIEVSGLDCTSVNQTGDYQYKVEYNSLQDYSFASRTVRWMLSGNMRYFAVRFEAFTVADKLEIFLNDNTEPLTAYISGSQNNINDTTQFPYRLQGTPAFVLDLQGWQNGDYLTFRITPSVLEQNTNTNWILRLKCLEESVADFEANCALFTPQMQAEIDISTIYMVNEPSACRYAIYATMGAPAINMGSSHPLYKYCLWNDTASGITTNVFTTGEIGMAFSYSTFGNWQTQFSGSSTCVALEGIITLSKVSNLFTFVFTDVDDYNRYKARYDSMMASSWANDWVDDPTSYYYYRYAYIYWRKAVSCGDTQTATYIHFHITSIFTFDDQNMTMQIEILNPANQCEGAETCVTTCTSISSRVSMVAGTLNLSASYLGESSVGIVSPFAGSRVLPFVNATTTAFAVVQYACVDQSAPCYPDKTCFAPTYTQIWSQCRLYGKITNYSDPVNNFEVYDGINRETGCSTGSSSASYILIYKVVNGVQTFPIP